MMVSEEINPKKTNQGLSGQNVFVTGTHLETLGWWLISEIHKEGIIEPIILKVLKVGMIMLGAMIVLWILGWMIISKLSNCLLCITCFYEKIGRGDYCKQMPLGSIFKELNVQAAGMNRMVDEIKGREEDLRESEEQTRRLVEKSLDAIISINAAGNVVLWNPQAEIIFGWKQEQAIGLTLPDLIIPSRFVEKYNHAFKKLIESGDGRILNQRIEIEALRRSGEEFPVEISVSTYDLKHEIHFFAMVRDITDRKKSEQALREVTDTLENKVRDRTIDLNIARMEAEKASKAKSNFLAVMSHEIRTPMNAILGLTYLINNTELDPVQKNYMDLIQVSGDNLLLLINDILDLSKIESGVFEIETTGFDLQEVLVKVVNINRVKAEQKGLEVIFNEGQGIAGRFVGDPLRLGQVFSNLVTNAVKFTESGSITINADRVKKEEGKAQFRVSIKDTGIGLTEEEMQGLFKPFVQADSSTTRKYGGSGLGLCISKNLLEMMGGEIRVESQKGYGSSFVFTFWLDIAATHDQYASRGLPKTRETFNPEVVRGLNILIVDDDDLNLLLAENMLAVYGVNTVTVNSGAKAIQLMEKNKFDLVLMDVQMPIMDGHETTRQIRKVNKDLPIIALTANAYKGDREIALKSGMNGYLAKPFKVSNLLQTIANLLPCDASEKEDSNAGRSENELRDPNQASRVLMVDDDHLSLQIIQDSLKNLGAQVTSVDRGKEAIKLLQQFKFDLVFMDISGAETDGYETTRQIREQKRFQNLPIIALTGKSIEEDKQKALDSGMNACLTKPFELNQIMEIAKKYLPTPYQELECLEPEKSSSSGSSADFPEISGLDLYETFYREGRSSDWYYGLLDKFAEALTEIPPKILDALTENDFERAGFWVHKLKGNTGYFGAKELCDKTCLLQNEIKNPARNLEKIEHLLEQVLGRSREILSGINHWRKKNITVGQKIY
jgi:PAS domain S-box-containing protein